MTKPIPKVIPRTWIVIDRQINGYVFSVSNDDSLEVGYFQNHIKAIRETVVWDGEQWTFKYSGPNGSYLRGEDEAFVKRGPYV